MSRGDRNFSRYLVLPSLRHRSTYPSHFLMTLAVLSVVNFATSFEDEHTMAINKASSTVHRVFGILAGDEKQGWRRKGWLMWTLRGGQFRGCQAPPSVSRLEVFLSSSASSTRAVVIQLHLPVIVVYPEDSIFESAVATDSIKTRHLICRLVLRGTSVSSR